MCTGRSREEDYNGAITVKINNIYSADRQPGGAGNVSDDKYAQLVAKYGGSLRALGGGVSRQPSFATVPTAEPATQPVTGAGGPTLPRVDEIPF
jgi:hypothetical protein